jgi:hypothetical protein
MLPEGPLTGVGHFFGGGEKQLHHRALGFHHRSFDFEPKLFNSFNGRG